MSEQNNYNDVNSIINDILPDLQAARDYYKNSGDINNQVRIDEKIGKISNMVQQNIDNQQATANKAKEDEAHQAELNAASAEIDRIMKLYNPRY